MKKFPLYSAVETYIGEDGVEVLRRSVWSFFPIPEGTAMDPEPDGPMYACLGSTDRPTRYVWAPEASSLIGGPSRHDARLSIPTGSSRRSHLDALEAISEGLAGRLGLSLSSPGEGRSPTPPDGREEAA